MANYTRPPHDKAELRKWRSDPANAQQIRRYSWIGYSLLAAFVTYCLVEVFKR